MKSTKYAGKRHNGIMYEINMSEPYSNIVNIPTLMQGVRTEIWCSYIILLPKQIPEKHHKDLILEEHCEEFIAGGREHRYYDYAGSGIISSLDLHCGCTFYDITYDSKGEALSIKIGCDYNHYWDEGNQYTLDYVESEIKESIDRLIRFVPDIKVYDDMTGEYVDRKLSEEKENTNE